MTSSWTPHWLEKRLDHGSNWVSKTLLLDKSGKQNTAGQYVSIAQVKLAAFWKVVKVRNTPLSLANSRGSMCWMVGNMLLGVWPA